MSANCKVEKPAHSKLGASSAHRWMECEASIREIEKVPDEFRRMSSDEADEGTRAHDYLAKKLEGKIASSEIPEENEMREAVQYAYDAICTQLAMAKNEAPEGAVFYGIEHKFDLSHIDPDFFGTADIWIYFHKQQKLSVIDYKHGKGILVEVGDEQTGEFNPQLGYYGLGALTTLSHIGRVQNVELTIVQPRCNHPSGNYIRSIEVPSSRIIDFAFELQAKAERTRASDAKHKPGEYCRFCPAIVTCEAMASRALVEAQEEFGVVDENGNIPLPKTEEQLAKAMNWLPTLKAWVKAVDQYAYRYAMNGHKIPGYKLVNKRKHRKWADETDALIVLRKGGLKDFDLFEPQKMRTPAQIEKIVTKDEKKAIQSLIVSESSGLKLVPESEKGDEVLVGPVTEFDAIEDVSSLGL